MQASSHNLQGLVDGGVNEAGVSTAAPDRSAVSLSACMVARSSAYAYFLETVVGRSEM